eukprot:1015889-Pyramimonas_sp.AAC.1
MKQTMKMAARMTRGALSCIAASELLSGEPKIIADARALTLRGIARAVWFQDVKLAQLLRADAAAGPAHLHIHDNQ